MKKFSFLVAVMCIALYAQEGHIEITPGGHVATVRDSVSEFQQNMYDSAFAGKITVKNRYDDGYGGGNNNLGKPIIFQPKTKIVPLKNGKYKVVREEPPCPYYDDTQARLCETRKICEEGTTLNKCKECVAQGMECKKLKECSYYVNQCKAVGVL